VADVRPARRRRWITIVAVVTCLVLLGAAIWTDVDARTRTRHEDASLVAATSRLASLRHDVAVTEQSKALTTAKRDALVSQITSILGQLASVNAALSSTNAHAFVQDADINTLQTCLGGVQNALGQIAAENNVQAAKDIAAVSGPCTQLAGGTNSGLVYPFDFPDPDVVVVGQTYYAFATNSVAGNIQIISSTDLTQWNAIGNALPSLPTWATTHFTWSPSVAFIGGRYVLYYAVVPTGSNVECISAATSAQPQGPFVDSSTAPLECQKALGGSIDPAPFVDTNGTAYLVWKSGGSGSRIWSQQLDGTGTAFAPGSTPTSLLVPDQPWEAGTVEAPDLVAAGGHYVLFFSGNDWKGAKYAVGAASCAGPLGPCADASPGPILSSGAGVAGPGGESVFADTNGNFWIAFHAWIPGAVGFPNSRALYLRRLDLSGPVPAVGSPA
jgi:Glycosyl hydrolases family 43